MFFGRKARGILAPRPGIEPAPPSLEGEVLNHWTAREAPKLTFFKKSIYLRESQGDDP